jgi:hypothetical protein
MRRVLLAIGLLLLLSAGLVLAADGAAPSWEIPRFVIAGGGGTLEVRGYALTGTIGQAVVGRGSSGIYSVCSGFWGGRCGEAVMAPNQIYLPLVVRNVSGP